jgi:serine protease Do
LLNLQGEVIGVNAAIMSESGGFEGIGFSIPSDMAMHIAKELIANGKVIRGWLGISIQDLTPDLARSLGLSSNKGAVVADVITGSPADKAGIKKGDVIVAYQGEQVPDASTLRNDVSLSAVGKDVKLTVWRSGKNIDLTVTVASQQEQDKALAASLEKRLAVAVGPISPQEMNKYGLESQSGVIIVRIDPKGPLGAAGFEVGDIILQVNQQAIKGPEDFAALMDTLPPNQKVTFLVLDHKSGEAGYVQVVIP